MVTTKKLMKLFSELGVDLILHGHSHETKDYSRKGLRFLNAGGRSGNREIIVGKNIS